MVGGAREDTERPGLFPECHRDRMLAQRGGTLGVPGRDGLGMNRRRVH